MYKHKGSALELKNRLFFFFSQNLIPHSEKIILSEAHLEKQQCLGETVLEFLRLYFDLHRRDFLRDFQG